MRTGSDEKVLQQLMEARVAESVAARVLRSQIRASPDGPFRAGLVQHLEETREHARLLRSRIRSLEQEIRPVARAIGLAEGLAGRALAVGRIPLDWLRGADDHERALEQAKAAAAAEALEIATYIALERVARRAGDGPTADLAVAIRQDEERMLERVLAGIPALMDAVCAVTEGWPSWATVETAAMRQVGTAPIEAPGRGAQAAVRDAIVAGAVTIVTATSGTTDVDESSSTAS